MADSKQQPEFRPPSYVDVREALREALPSLRKLVEVGQNLFGGETPPYTSFPCASCPTKEGCSQPCDALNALLPGVYAGRGHREHLTELDPDDLEDFRKVRILQIFEQYEPCRHIFTPKQWTILYLYYHDGKKEEQIAREIGKARTTVSDLLIRARRRKENFDKKMRREKLDYLKRKLPE
jgi:predicted DNA-binding protein YlxM (UPF0122 family)